MPAFLSIVSIAVALLVAFGGWWESARAESTKARLAHRAEQMRDLYGPLAVQRRLSEAPRSRLPQQVGATPWRLVHHIGDIRRAADAADYSTYSAEQVRAVERILECGDNAVALIQKGAGLIEYPAPKAFQTYVDHHERLRMSWNAGRNQTENESLPFPGGSVGESLDDRCSDPLSRDTDIDCAIHIDTRTIQVDLSRLRKDDDDDGRVVRALTKPGVLLGAIALLVLLGVVALVRNDRATRPVLVNDRNGVVCGTISTNQAGEVFVGDRKLEDVTYLVAVESC